MFKTALTTTLTSLLLALPGSALAAPAVTGEFPVSESPRHLTQGPDGNIWVALSSKIAKVTPAGAVTEFDPANVGFPEGITTGSDGNLWVTQSDGVAKFSPTDPNAAVKFTIAGFSDARAITTGPDGNLWTASGSTVYKIPPANVPGMTSKTIGGLGARGIARGGDRMWVADFAGKQVLSITTDLNTVTPHPTGDGPQEVAGGPGGQVAYTAPGLANQLGRLTQGAAALKSTAPGPDPFGITLGPDGAYWTAEFATSKLGRMTTTGKVTPLGGLSANSGPRQITSGPGNTLWVSLETGNKIARVSGVTNPPPAKPKPATGKRDAKAPVITRVALRRTKVRFRLSEKAGVRIKIKRRNGKTRTLKRNGKAGANSVRIKRLRPGRYRVTVTAKDAAGNRSAPKLARLKVKRR